MKAEFVDGTPVNPHIGSIDTLRVLSDFYTPDTMPSGGVMFMHGPLRWRFSRWR